MHEKETLTTEEMSRAKIGKEAIEHIERISFGRDNVIAALSHYLQITPRREKPESENGKSEAAAREKKLDTIIMLIGAAFEKREKHAMEEAVAFLKESFKGTTNGLNNIPPLETLCRTICKTIFPIGSGGFERTAHATQAFNAKKKETIRFLLSHPETRKYVLKNWGHVIFYFADHYPDVLEGALLEDPELLEAAVTGGFATPLLEHANDLPNVFEKILRTEPLLLSFVIKTPVELSKWLHQHPHALHYVLERSAPKDHLETYARFAFSMALLNSPRYLGELLQNMSWQDHNLLLILYPFFKEEVGAIICDGKNLPRFLDKEPFFNFLRKHKELKERVLRSVKIIPAVREKIQSVPEKHVPLFPDESKHLLGAGCIIQSGLHTEDEYKNFWAMIKEKYSIEVDQKKPIAFGLEIEPESKIGIHEDNEMRSFAVSSPLSLAALIELYTDTIATKFPHALARKDYGALLGTLHLNIGLSAEEYQKRIEILGKMRRVAGLFCFALSPPSKIERNLESGYLSPGAELNIYPDTEGIAAMSADEQIHAIRLEMKGFGIPQDEDARVRFIEGIVRLGGLFQETRRIEKFEVNEHMQKRAAEILDITREMRYREIELEKLTPMHLPLSEYRTHAAELEEPLRKFVNVLDEEIRTLSKKFIWREEKEKELLQKLRDTEHALAEKITPDLMMRYRTGEDISKILKNLGFGEFWMKVSEIKEEIESLREETKELPAHTARERLKHEKTLIEDAITHRHEAIKKVEELRKAIIRMRKRVATLQQALYTELITAA